MTLPIVLGAVFFAVVISGWAISQFIASRATVSERLATYIESSDKGRTRTKTTTQPVAEKKPDIWGEIDHLIEKRTFVQKMILEFQKADLKLRYSEYVGLYFLITLVPGLIGYALTKTVPGFLMLGLPGLVIPRFYVKWRQFQRIKRIDGQLVDALILISNALKSGYSFLQGMELVAEEAPKPISQEFRRMLRETNLGYPLEQALDGVSERVPSEDLDLVITVVKIQRQIGGNLAEVLDKIIHTIRERIRIKGEINTLTAQGKLQGIILTLLPPAMCVGIYMMAPDFMSPLFTTMLGKLMLGVAFVLQMIGGFMIRKIVDIKV
ncbi:MAG TPA: type II secretion system F family protein [bacterium]|jgi:tight adherence protein B